MTVRKTITQKAYPQCLQPGVADIFFGKSAPIRDSVLCLRLAVAFGA